ncbi:fumarylacetoacetate hydrolase family protein [Catellatospora tritici]|uniref:fumarylacetoacetate hydrolase family protein n=1 Tax=Catellatospora tritici TaxID=2851566 RepID=UPI001C2D6E40|nr:fumarylacetoacetate hydrolase family protein [Catellatospora tritici]MBV1849567.1 fumarylacetoacetate hydrolase family protein [Catellatospora tritici]
MRLSSVRHDGGEDVGIATGTGIVLLSTVNRLTGARLGPSLLDIIRHRQLPEIARAVAALTELGDDLGYQGPVVFAPLLREPPKLWGAGLNYARHAADLEVEQPEGMPGSYLRPSSTVIGDGDAIIIPRQSQRVTAEAELGVVIGVTCRDVRPEDARSVIAGYTTVLDMTAEDAIRINPRFIPWAKAFDTFCSIGPWLVTPDEVEDLTATRVATIVNGETIADNVVAAMMRDPFWLVSHFSAGMTLEAGTVIATGTPGAGVIRDGDVVEAHVEGIGRLRNPVVAAASVLSEVG